MDYSKFCSDEFNMKKWVNSALQLEENPNTLVMKLQLLMQEVNSSLEEATVSLLSDIPRVVTEIQGLNHEAVLLRKQMDLVRSDISKVQHDTEESMSSVVKLDQIKERMLATERKLKQADNWCVLNDQIDQLFLDQDLEGASDKLGEMRSALSGLANLPDYEDRCERLNSLSNKLEAILSPKLIATFNNGKVGEAQLFYRIFSDMGRRGELYNYYYRTHKTNCSKMFTELRTTGSVDSWLHHFYSTLLELYHAQLSWSNSVFEDHHNIVLSLLIRCLDATDLKHDISNYISDSQTPVHALQTLLDIMSRFASSISKGIPDTDTEISEQLGRAIVGPYITHLSSFGDKVKSTLLRDVHTLPMRLKSTSSDSLSELHASVKRVVPHVRDYIPLCVELTDGNTLVDVVAAIEFYFDLLVEKINAFTKELRVAFGLDGAKPVFQEDHWVGFQSCFRFLQILGECYMDIKALEEESIVTIKTYLSKRPKLIEVNFWKDTDATKFTQNQISRESLMDGSKTDLFAKTVELFASPVNQANKLCVDFVLSHIKNNTNGIHLSMEWVSEEGAVFTPSPLTYITTLGDYLLLLPQQLEPFFLDDNLPLDTALRLIDFAAYPSMSQDVEGDAFAWLTCVCKSTMFALVEMILKIHRLTGAGCKQLVADVGYISNVMGALEVPLSRDIVDISKLLSCSIDQIDSTETAHIPKYLRSKIAAMRKPAF